MRSSSTRTEFVAGYEWEALPNTTLGIRDYPPEYRPRCWKTSRTARWSPTNWRLRQASAAASTTSSPTRAARRRSIRRRSRSTRRSLRSSSTTRSTSTTRWSSRSTGAARTGRRWRSYRYSRLRGNFEGFYRDDNGQSDPGISSLYDFPTNDPDLHVDRCQAARLHAATFVSWVTPNGILPLDRPNQVKLNGNYVLVKNLNLGANLNLSVGKAADADGREPQLLEQRVRFPRLPAARAFRR